MGTKYKMTLDFIVDVCENNGVALTMEDIANALKNSGYKVDLVNNVTPGNPALFVYGNHHRISMKLCPIHDTKVD